MPQIVAVEVATNTTSQWTFHKFHGRIIRDPQHALSSQRIEPPKGEPTRWSTLEVEPGIWVQAVEWGDYIFVHPSAVPNPQHWTRDDAFCWTFPWTLKRMPMCEPFFQAQRTGQGHTMNVLHPPSGRRLYGRETKELTSDLSQWTSELDRDKTKDDGPYIYVPLTISYPGAEDVQVTFRYSLPNFGEARIVKDQNGHNPKVVCDVQIAGFTYRKEKAIKVADEESPLGGLNLILAHLQNSKVTDSPDEWWEAFFQVFAKFLPEFAQDLVGLKSTLNKKDILPTIERLQKETPLDWKFFQWLQSSGTWNKRKNNSLLATFLQKVGTDYDATLAALKGARQKAPHLDDVSKKTYPGYSYSFYNASRYSWDNLRRALCSELPGVREIIQEQEAKNDWRKAQDNLSKADGLGVTASEFPLLRTSLEQGNIPFGVFNQPQGAPINREFPLWEQALTRKGWSEVISEISKDAARRGTYERNITSYLSFLFRIEKYLERHTGRKWSAMPKYVQSQWELEMDDPQNENGTATKRSAFTPTVDNEKSIVTVPYVAVSVTGVRTQWCYARHYHIFEEGFLDTISDGIVIRDLEPKLNGRDDYGLCFYTLTGTETARGYPTFLIIFERLQGEKSKKVKGGTRVHFHRVRPQRSKDGVLTPACQLVEATYQYMAGNIPASEIAAQQGDMIYIKHPNDPLKAGAKVADPQHASKIMFESHEMVSDIPLVKLSLYKSTAASPSNRLGFINAQGGMSVLHPEHENIQNLPAGWYEIRRCRSWEANPKAIWSYTVD